VVHACTLHDFLALTDDLGLVIESCAALSEGRPARSIDPRSVLENWRAEAAVFVLRRG